MRRYNGGIKTGSASRSGSSASGIWDLPVSQVEAGANSWPGMALYAFTSATFRPATVGRYGPTLAQAKTGVTGDANVTFWRDNTTYFNVTATGIMTWVVPQTSQYSIEVWGAQGGNGEGNNYWGGYGARMKGTFTLVAGDTLKILVGQSGGNSYGGGGGMTAVATNANVPLIVAGGGNTTSPWSSFVVHAVTTTSGTPGQNYANGGTSGYGGGTGPYGTSDGGAGFYGNGSANGYNQTVPLSFVNGGTGNINGCGNSIGGFGGGSASDGCYYGQSGPGGGYSGGGAGSTSSCYGGAGGSYNAGSNQSNDNGNSGTATLAGNGKCIITKL